MFDMSGEDLALVLAAIESYDDAAPHYDQIFNDTGRRLRDQGFATKEDVAVVTFWKAINLSTPWVRAFLNLDPLLIREATQEAFRRGISDRNRLVALQKLPGFRWWGGPNGGAIPSTLLCCWDPHDYAVTDRRAREGLLNLVGYQVKDLLDYWQAVRIIRDATAGLRPNSVSARDIDKALFTLAGDRKRL